MANKKGIISLDIFLQNNHYVLTYQHDYAINYDVFSKYAKKVIFPSKNLYDFADLVRACDIITDSEGSLYEGANTEKVLKVEFELETSY